ncbi:MAG: hypothetical protein ACYDDS_13360 [Candidatus Sulfotelmatobacter sp.]
MNQSLRKARSVDFEEFGYLTMLECGDIERAVRICGSHLHAYEYELQPELARINSEILGSQYRASALHAGLYDRPIPVNDATMLTQSLKCRIFVAFTVLAAVACMVGNMTTFYLLGFGPLLTLLAALGITALPLVVGHLAYEWLVASQRWLQIFVVLAAVALCFGGVLKLGEARRDTVDIAASTPATKSYVDGTSVDNAPEQEKESPEVSEGAIHRTLGEAMLLIMIAADLVLGFLVGLIVRLHTDEDYTAWKKLKDLHDLILRLRERTAQLLASLEIAKKLCMAGILRAQNVRAKRRPAYHRALTIVLLVVLSATRAWTQNIERYEGILIDTSESISRGGTTSELFRDYLTSTKKLLLTEPANSRVWVSSISTDSFGGVHEIIKGWTPDAHGIFTDDLNRARRELASNFEVKSSGMAPVASGTDIFGGLWQLKAIFESSPKADTSHTISKIIWIFSDMMNETKDFPMPALIEVGSEKMLDRAKTGGLIVPLNGYKVYVLGASTSSLTPQMWFRVREFWSRYFSAAGAELVFYSAESNPQR